MLELKERPVETKTKTKKPLKRTSKSQRFRALARGYRALKRDKAIAYQAAAEALEQVEQQQS